MYINKTLKNNSLRVTWKRGTWLISTLRSFSKVLDYSTFSWGKRRTGKTGQAKRHRHVNVNQSTLFNWRLREWRVSKLLPSFHFLRSISLSSFLLPSRGILFLLRVVWTIPSWNYIIDTAKFTSVYIRHVTASEEYALPSRTREWLNHKILYFQEIDSYKLSKKYMTLLIRIQIHAIFRNKLMCLVPFFIL